MDGGLDPGRARLQRLGAADLAAVDGDGRVVRHVLRLEGAYRHAAIGEKTAEAGSDQRVADIGPSAHQHEDFAVFFAHHAMTWA